jgi:hypothetical protein
MAKLSNGGPRPRKSTRKKRSFNPRVFRSKRAYSFVEIADALDTHIRTVQRWRKEGLPILHDGTKPFLVMGQHIHEFLKNRAVKRKKPLRGGEFFCPKCQQPHKSSVEAIRLEFTKRLLGAAHRQVIIHGQCEVCGVRLSLFSSEQKAIAWRDNTPTLSEHPEGLSGTKTCSTNADMEGLDQHEQSQCEE